jgi:hypothetical protein
MSKLGINTGTTPNDGTGDTLLDAVIKINRNFNEIYNTIGNGTNLGIGSLSQLIVSGVVTANSFRPSSGYYQSPNGTNAFYVYDTSGDVSFQGKIVTNYIRSNTNLDPTITVSDLDLQFARNVIISGVTTSTGGFVGNLTGSSTYASTAGIATYATSSGISTYTLTAGIATYASSAGVSTNVKGTGNRVLYNSSTDTTTTSSNLAFDGTTLSINSTPGSNASSVYLTGTPFGGNTKNGLFGIGQLGFNDSNIIANFTSNVNSYSQVIIQNLSTGNAASADFIVNSDSPQGQTYYGDFGINGTGYNGGGPFGDVSGTYLYAAGGTLSIGTNDAYDFRIATGNAFQTPVTRVTVAAVTGNVGIGSTIPTNTFTVGGGTSTINLYVSGVSTFAGGITTTSGTLFAKQFWASGISSFSNSVYFANNANLYIGNGLNFANDGTTSTITENGPGNLIFNSNGGSIRIKLNNVDSIVANEAASADLYYNGSKKFSTTSTGVTVTDDITVGGNLNASGVMTAAQFNGDINSSGFSTIANINSSGVITAANINSTGVMTAAQFNGDINSSGFSTIANINSTGVVTATAFNGPVNATGFSTIANINASGVVTATVFNGNINATGFSTITNINSTGVMTATAFNGPVNATGFSTIANINASGIVTSVCLNVTGFSTAAGGSYFQNILKEKINIVAGKLSDNTNINLENGTVHFFTTTETTTSTPNIRFNSTTTLNSSMAVGDSVSVTIITTTAAAAYSATWNIDGTGTGVTRRWLGGSAPTTGGSSGNDVYNCTIIKTASATYTLLLNLSNFA